MTGFMRKYKNKFVIDGPFKNITALIDRNDKLISC